MLGYAGNGLLQLGIFGYWNVALLASYPEPDERYGSQYSDAIQAGHRKHSV